MRIGELLVQHGWTDGPGLQRALAEQAAHTGGTRARLCSLLISRGVLDPDDASRALGELHGVAAALQKHLAYRDRTLAALVPGRFARSRVILPIGRQRDGTLVIAVRDPSDAVATALGQLVPGPLTLAVAPASQLEQIVALMYPTTDDAAVEAESYDVDLKTGPISLDFSNLALVGLDDIHVSKDPTQSGSHTVSALPRTLSSQPGIAIPRTLTPAPTSAPVVAPIALDAICMAITASSSRDDMTDIAMRFAASRWHSALLLMIKEGAALGHRGHGGQLTPDLVQAVTLPLAAPSLVKSAFDTADVATETRPGAIQDRLVRLLGTPTAPTAAAVVVGTRVACVLVVGDALVADTSATQDLDRLVTTLGEGYARIVREAKR